MNNIVVFLIGYTIGFGLAMFIAYKINRHFNNKLMDKIERLLK